MCFKFSFSAFLFLILSFQCYAQLDRDNDGIPSDWETQYGLSDTDPTDAFLDPDGDQILNLQEYIMQFDPRVSEESIIYEYDPATPISELYEELRRTTLGPVVVRMPQGTYQFEYAAFWSPNHRVMLQGGWNDDFSDYDPCRYKTVLTNEADWVFAFGGITNRAGVVLDGVEVISVTNNVAPVLFVTDQHDTDVHAHNCTFSGGDGGMVCTPRFGDHHMEVTISNCLFRDHIRCSIPFAGDEETTLDIRIINCTVDSPDAFWGNMCFSRFQTTNKINIDIRNSIFGDNNVQGTFYKPFNFIDVFNISATNSYVPPSRQAFTVTETAPVITTPTYTDPALGDYTLTAGHPFIDGGIFTGLPFEGSARDIGYAEVGQCICDLDISCAFTDETSESAADGKAVLTIRDGVPPYQIAWSNNSNQDSILNLSPGIYSVTVIDNAGCEAFCEQEILAFKELDFTVDTDDDGIPDIWEEENGLDLLDPLDAFCDADNDQILNLFEFQMRTNPQDFSSPAKFQITPSMTETEIKAVMALAVDTTIYMRFAEGDYSLSFGDDDTGFRSASEGYRLIIQGGWDEDFLVYDPFTQPTILRPSGTNTSIIKLNSVDDAGMELATMVVDGFHCVDGGEGVNGTMDFRSSEGTAYHSFYNTTFYDNKTCISLIEVDKVVDHQFWFVNSIIDNNKLDDGIIYAENREAAVSRWRILNSTLSRYGRDEGDGIRLHQPDNTAVQNITLANSIIWDDSPVRNSLLFDNCFGEIRIFADNVVYNQWSFSGGAPLVILDITSVFINENPQINHTTGVYPVLRLESPFRRLGTDIGLPFRADRPDIGFNRGIRIDPSEVAYSYTNALCGSWSGTITFTYDGTEPIEFSIDGIEYSEELFYDGLNNGNYNLYVRQNGCEVFVAEIEIEDDFSDCGKDTDKDGMKDAYELEFGFDPNDPTDALGDADCDQVLNLFEQMLLTDPHNPSDPVAVPFSPNQSQEEFARHIVSSQDKVLLLQLQEGDYNLDFFTEEWWNGPKIAGWSDETIKRMVIQGGWNEDYTEYNPFCYRTKVTSESSFINLKVNQADSIVVILDGLELKDEEPERGESTFFSWNFGGMVQYGYHNCSLVGLQTAIEFRLDVGAGPLDFFFINSTLADNHHNFELTLPNGTPHINYNFINSAVTNSLSPDKGNFELQKVGTDSTNVRITNCIFWDSIHVNSTNIFPDKNIYLEVTNSVFGAGNVGEYASYAPTGFVDDRNPNLDLIDGHYLLPEGSSYLGAGIQTGLPYDYAFDNPHVGVNPKVVRVNEIQQENTYCNAENGWIDVNICSPLEMEYRLDSLPWRPIPFFSGLTAGEYVLQARSINCGEVLELPVTVRNQDSDLFVRCEISGDEISAIVEGGDMPITYVWNDNMNSTDSLISGIDEGSYTITVTDAAGCTASCTAVVLGCELEVNCSANIISSPSVDFHDIKTEVTGGQGNLNYTWSDGSTADSLRVIAGGIYSVTVTDEENCSDSCSFEVLIDCMLSIEIDSLIHPTCNASNGPANGSIAINVMNGTEPLNYEWSGNVLQTDIQNQTGLGSGSYTITVTALDGCTATRTIDLVEPDTINVLALVNPSDCSQSGQPTGSITTQSAGGTPPYSYQWQSTDPTFVSTTDQNLTRLAEGFYNLTVTDANGCTWESIYEITEANPQLCSDCDFSLEDSDDDGIPNDWEIANGLDACDPVDAFCDYDGDDVINLFEFQLDTDPFSENSPRIVTVNAATPIEQVESLIISSGNDPVVIRMAQGSYDWRFNYGGVLGTNPDPEVNYNFLFQGGWDSSFCDFDPFLYKTRIENNRRTFFFNTYLNGSGSTTPLRSAYIFEGLIFDETRIDVNSPNDIENLNYVSIYNCGFNFSGVSVGSNTNSDCRYRFINNSFFDAAGAISSFNLGGLLDIEAQHISRSDGLLFSSNFATGIDAGGFNGTLTDINIENSIIWDEVSFNSVGEFLNLGFGLETTAGSKYNVTAFNSILSDFFTTDRPAIGDWTFDVLQIQNIDPQFTFINDHYLLPPTSPFKEKAERSGIPSENPIPDLGVNQFAYSAIRLIDSLNIIQPSCDLNNGSISLKMIEHYKDFEFSLNTNNNFNSVDSFPGLGPGDYIIYIRTADNCAHFQQKVTLVQPDGDAFEKLEVRASCGESNGVITINPVGGVISDFEYAINDTMEFQSSNVFEDLSANVYLLFYRPIATPECIISDFFILNQNSDIALTALDSTDTTCGKMNGRVNLEVANADGAPNYFFRGGSPQSTPDFDNLAAGDYTFLVEDSRGCRDSIELTIEPSLGIILTDTLITNPTCGLDNGQVLLQTNDPGSVTSVTLNGDPASLTINFNLAPGPYEFIVTDNSGCRDSLSFDLESSVPVDIINIDTIGTRCALDNGVVIIGEVEGNPTEYSTDGVNYFSVDSFDGLALGDYLLYAQNANCADTLPFSIAASTTPELTLADFDDTACGEDNGSLEVDVISGTGPYTYNLDSLNNQSGVFTSLPAGEYIAYVQDFADCTDSTDISIDQSEAVVLTATIQEGLCGELGAIELSASFGNGNVYAEGDGDFESQATYTELEGGEYIFYVRTDEDCLDTLVLDVPVYSIPEIELENTTPALCEDPVGSITVTGNGGKGDLSFALGAGEFSDQNIFEDLAPDNYTLTISDDTGCTSSEVIVVEASPQVRIENLSAEQLFCGDFLSAVQFTPEGGTGTLTYSLTDSNGDEVNEADGLAEGQYRLLVEDDLGCQKSELIVVKKEACQIYIPTIFDPNADGIDQAFRLGVPAQSNFTLESFSIYDRWGNLVYNKQDIDPLTFTDWWDGTYNGQEVAQGVYVYVIELGGEKSELINGTVTILK